MEMVEYIDFLSKRLKTASIERRLASLTSIFKLTQCDTPFESPEVILTKKPKESWESFKNRQRH